MPTNNFLNFCGTDTGTNLLTQSDYNLSADRTSGNKPGVASAKLVNKALRQSAFITSQIAQYMANKTGSDVLDDDNAANLIATMNYALTMYTVAAKTSAYGVTVLDQLLTGDATGGTFAFTLPTAVGIKGKFFVFKKIDASANVVTISTTSAQTIDGVTSRALSSRYGTLIVISDGANWIIIAYSGATGTANQVLTSNGTTNVPTMQDLPQAYFAGYMTFGNAAWTRSNTSFGNATAFSTIGSLTTQRSKNLGTVSQFNTAGNYYPAILVTPTITGTFEVVANVEFEANTSGAFGQLELYDDTASASLDDAYSRVAAANMSTKLPLRAMIALTAGVQQSFMIRMAASAGQIAITSNGVSSRLITWGVKFAGY